MLAYSIIFLGEDMNDKKRRPDEPIPARVFVLIPTER